MKIRNLRWYIAGLLFLASVLNYIDRQTLSILAPTIQKDLGINDLAYGNVLNAFMVAYTVSYLLSGALTDRIGSRVSMGLFVAWWSVSNMLTGLARSVGSLGAFRFSLGLGEAGNYTAAPKAVQEWFTVKERGLAIGIYSLGGTVGATVAPILIVHLEGHHGWRSVFAVTGALGLIWLVPWLWLNRPVATHPFITEEERELLVPIPDPTPASNSAPEGEVWDWPRILGTREVWLLLLARLVTDPVWYFFLFWFAKYLYSVRDVAQKQLTMTWVVFLAADIGALVGGWLSGRLIARGNGPVQARLLAMLGGAVLVPLSAAIPGIYSLTVVMGIAMIAAFAHFCWLVNISAVVVDLIPKRSMATVFGLVAAGSSAGGIIMNKVVSDLATAHNYNLWFYIMAFLHPCAWVMLTLGIRRPRTGSDPFPNPRRESRLS